MIKSKFIRGTRNLAGLLALATAAVLPGTALAQATGNVDVDINLTGGITILYYYSAIDVNINMTDVAGTLPGSCTGSGDTFACNQGAPAAVTATPVAGELRASFTLTPPALGLSATSLPLVLQNVWAVRAIGGGANTTVAIAAGGGAGNTLVGTVAGTSIGLSNFQVQSVIGPAASIQFPDPGLVNARNGDVRMSLDLTNATALGFYSSVVGANNDVNYVLTVTNT